MAKNKDFKYDESWKLLVKFFTQQFLEFFYPQLASVIDFSKPITFKEQELLEKGQPPDKFALKVDNLLEVFLKSNHNPAFVLIHIEVEANEPSNLILRMFKYFITLKRIYPNFDIYPLVIYIGFKPFNLKEYQINNFGFKLQFSCSYYDINDYSEDDYIGHKNPFTIFLLISMWINKYREKNRSKTIYGIKKIIEKLKTELERRSMTKENFIFLQNFFRKVLSLSSEDDLYLKTIFNIKTNSMYENIKTNFQANEILAGQVRMWQEGKSLETFIFEGEQIGLLKGEFKKARETAKSLKNQGVGIQIIAQATGLSIQEIEIL